MKKLMTLLLLLGLSMPVMADGSTRTAGENADEKVNCEDIFQGKGEGKGGEGGEGESETINTEKQG